MINTNIRNATNYWLKDIFVLTIFLGSLFFIFLGNRPLFVPDEGRYAEIIREMVTSNDYVTPYLNHIKYFEKPVLFYWLGVFIVKLGGLNLWSLRSINALLSLLCCLFTYFTARKLYNRTTGILASVILGTSVLYFVMAHMVSLDLTVTVFLTLSLYAFLLGLQQPFGLRRRICFWLAFATAALSVLTKGLIGILFPFMVVGAWIIFTNQWRLLKNIYLPSSLLIFVLIAAPWHVMAGYRNPEFFYFYFIEQHFLRYTTLEVGHYQPAWFFIPALIIGFFPWIAFLPQTLVNLFCKRQINKMDLFFLLWALLIFVFFSFSKSKLIPYILPVFPPLSILVARYWQKLFQQQATNGIKIAYLFLLILSGVVVFVFYTFPNNTTVPFPHMTAIYLNSAALILFVGILISFIYIFRNIKTSLRITILTSWLFLLIILAAIPFVDARTIRPLADVLKSIIQPNDEVVTYNQYYQDLPFYLERRITILNWRNELTFGMQHQNTKAWMIDDKTFWEHWHSQQRLFVMLSIDEFKRLSEKNRNKQFYPIGKTLNTVVISNKKTLR